MSIKTAFLDLDGVVANFTKAACKALEIEYPSQSSFSYEWLYKVANRPKKEFWKKIRGEEFWLSLEPFPWANDIIDIIDGQTDWRFLSKPTFDSGCYSGKYKWIEKHFPKHVDKLILINGKKNVVCSGYRSLLIDDRPENIKDWQDVSGTAFFWQEVSDDHYVGDRLLQLKDMIKYPLRVAGAYVKQPSA